MVRSNASLVMVKWDFPVNRMMDTYNSKYYLSVTLLAGSNYVISPVFRLPHKFIENIDHTKCYLYYCR